MANKNLIDGKGLNYFFEKLKSIFAPIGIITEMTQAQYDALSYEKKMNGTAYFITDADIEGQYENGDEVSY